MEWGAPASIRAGRDGPHGNLRAVSPRATNWLFCATFSVSGERLSSQGALGRGQFALTRGHLWLALVASTNTSALDAGRAVAQLASPTEAHARSSDIRSAGGRRATRGPPSSRERDGLEVRPAGAEAEEWGAPWAPWSEQLGTEPSERLGGGAVFANASAAMDPVSGHLHGSPGSRWTSTTSPHPGRKDPARRARSTSLIRSARGKSRSRPPAPPRPRAGSPSSPGKSGSPGRRIARGGGSGLRGRSHQRRTRNRLGEASRTGALTAREASSRAGCGRTGAVNTG